MRVINREVLHTAANGFRALYKEELAVIRPELEQLAMVVPSDSPEETYASLNSLPQMREWVGDRHIHGLSAKNAITIRNKDWEASIGVDRNDFLFDKLGIVGPRVRQLARAYQLHRISILASLVAGGFTSLCFDGQYFFDTDHPVGRPGFEVSVSNKGTAVLSQEAILAGLAAMRSLKDESGNYLRIVGDTLVVSPQKWGLANQLMTADLIEGESNTTKGLLKVMVVEELADTPNAWAILCLAQPLKPFILQVVKEGEFVAMESPDDESVFMRKEFRYGVDSIDSAGYGLWQLAWGSTGAG